MQNSLKFAERAKPPVSRWTLPRIMTWLVLAAAMGAWAWLMIHAG